MKEFTKWLVEIEDQPGGMPPVNGGVTPSIPPDIASELSAIAEKLNALLKKAGIESKGGEPSPDDGLGDMDKGMSSPPTGGPPGAPPTNM